ncbi:aminotransferase class V-fold PLP-dependent enzyme [Sagittula sp. SSi028]|uniref:aminotransferase class V-fold PLP-dependent enzyme n=1 Tax=Sagittula sp. SSi028 TaxID=3400636 RepID=UPI003AF63D3C
MIDFSLFDAELAAPNVMETLRNGQIGDGLTLSTPFGAPKLLYADYIASGRALTVVEDFVRTQVLPFYANSHTEASAVGQAMTRGREVARARIAQALGAGPQAHVIFAGQGATTAVNRLVGLLDVPARVQRGEEIDVLIGPYEHHSNILPWRESGARVIEIAEAAGGGVDLADLESRLRAARGSVIGAFSAASNVTGILTDVDAVTELLKAHGALALWDYACAAPYVPMQMGTGLRAKDAIFYSSHKFAGGPGASGVLCVRGSVVRRQTPTATGGGTVAFVSPQAHRYSELVVTREEAGTPDGVGDIRAALVMAVKQAMLHAGAETPQALRAKGLAALGDHPRIDLLGPMCANALPIFAFRVRDGQGGYVHQQLVTRLLSDVHGVQARGGCACAGPYAHRLLGIGEGESQALDRRLQAGDEMAKPGWVRLNLSALMDDAKQARLLAAVCDIATRAADLSQHYAVDPQTARFRWAAELAA